LSRISFNSSSTTLNYIQNAVDYNKFKNTHNKLLDVVTTETEY